MNVRKWKFLKAAKSASKSFVLIATKDFITKVHELSTSEIQLLDKLDSLKADLLIKMKTLIIL